MQNKIDENQKTYQTFIKECINHVNGVQQKLALDSDKTRKIVEQNVFATYLNQRMEMANKAYFKNNFIHRNLYVTFIR